MTQKLSTMLFLACGAALSLAYISEYQFGLIPCILCVYQRIPYVVIMVLTTMALLVSPLWRTRLLYLCSVVFLANAALAFYHSGVERGIFSMLDGCTIGVSSADSIEAMRQQMLGKTAVPCDRPAFVLFGLSMAEWNMLYTLSLGLMTMRVLWRHKKRNKQDDSQEI